MEGAQKEVKVEKTKTVIAKDVEIVGTVKSDDNIQYEGKLKGDLSCGKKVVLGEKSSIKGNLTVDSVTIKGKVNGNVSANDRVELKSSAQVNGDIKARRLMIEDGVSFVGKSEVNPSGKPVVDASGSKKSDSDSKSADADDKAGGLFGRK